MLHINLFEHLIFWTLEPSLTIHNKILTSKVETLLERKIFAVNNNFVYPHRGVLQTLVEKHFPAPDRSRISRLLGIELPQTPLVEDYVFDNAGGSSESNKRKPVRQAAQKAIKKVKSWSSEDEISDEERNGGHSSGDEFKISNSESEDDTKTDDEIVSNASSEYNPFSGSDSDVEPWDRRQKKGSKKQKKSPKKRLSTQDKIQSMLASKTSKNKRNGDAVNAMPRHQQGMMYPGVNNQQVLQQTSHMSGPTQSAIERACSMKEELLAKIEKLGERLPPNTLDQLIDELGGPENVAEMTGRKGRVVQNEDGTIQYESRSEADSPLETLNLKEKQRCGRVAIYVIF